MWRMLGRSEFESHAVLDLTHILRTDAGEPTWSTYKQQACQPVGGQFLQLISEWLVRKTAS